MKKEKEIEHTIKDRLNIGDQIFYYDGYTDWGIEEVSEINKEKKYAVLTNNATISLYPGVNGDFKKLNPTKSILPIREGLTIKRATPELLKLRDAIIAKKKISNFIFLIQNDIMQKAEYKNWERWSTTIQDKLLNICGHMSKAIELAELTQEEEDLLKTNIESKVYKEPTKKRKK